MTEFFPAIMTEFFQPFPVLPGKWWDGFQTKALTFNTFFIPFRAVVLDLFLFAAH